MIQQSAKGIRVDGKRKEELASILAGLPESKGLGKLVGVLRLLEILANADEVSYLSLPGDQMWQKEADGQRLNAVFQLIIHDYRRPISLEEAASTANLSVSAFCRYFKLRTRKTFIQFLNEFRISTACRLLVEQQFPISQICYAVGFNNLSNFNRQFKQVTGKSPSEYMRLLA